MARRNARSSSSRSSRRQQDLRPDHDPVGCRHGRPADRAFRDPAILFIGGTDIGPVVSQAQLDQDLKYIDIGQSEGARLVSGGGLVTCDTEGYYLAPTLFADSEAAMRISRVLALPLLFSLYQWAHAIKS